MMTAAGRGRPPTLSWFLQGSKMHSRPCHSRPRIIAPGPHPQPVKYASRDGGERRGISENSRYVASPDKCSYLSRKVVRGSHTRTCNGLTGDLPTPWDLRGGEAVKGCRAGRFSSVQSYKGGVRHAPRPRELLRAKGS